MYPDRRQMLWTIETGRRLPPVLQTIVLAYVFDENPFRDSTEMEAKLKVCRGCDHPNPYDEDDDEDVEDPVMSYHIVMARLPIVMELCEDPNHEHTRITTWQGCQERRFIQHMRANQRPEITVWLCSPRCRAKMGGWPTLDCIRSMEDFAGESAIADDQYNELVSTTFMRVFVNRTSDGHSWPFELLDTAYQMDIIKLISTSIAGGWTGHYGVCDALGWDHLAYNDVVGEWPLAMLRMAPPLRVVDIDIDEIDDDNDMDTRL